MSDDEEDELAQLRAQRAARVGVPTTLVGDAELDEEVSVMQDEMRTHFPMAFAVSHRAAGAGCSETATAPRPDKTGGPASAPTEEQHEGQRGRAPCSPSQSPPSLLCQPAERSVKERPLVQCHHGDGITDLVGKVPSTVGARVALVLIASFAPLPTGPNNTSASTAPQPRPNVGPARPPPGALTPQPADSHTHGGAPSQPHPDPDLSLRPEHSTQRPAGPNGTHSHDPHPSAQHTSPTAEPPPAALTHTHGLAATIPDTSSRPSARGHGPAKRAWHSGGSGGGGGPGMLAVKASVDEDGEDEELEGGSGGEREEEEEEDDPYQLPVTHEVNLAGHEKAVTCMDVEHSGSRLLTGSMDYTVRIYDFAGMKSDLRSFRELEPCEGHPVHALSWSPSGDAFLAVTGACQAKIYDRDGRQKGEFIRGDMYIRDMKNTKGHVSGLCSGQWHPTDRASCMTCSEDGTVRIWDATAVTQKTVIKPTLAKQQRTAVTACSYSSDGALIGAGLIDGSIQIWNVAGKFGSSAAIGAVGVPKQQMVARQNWNFVTNPKQLVRNAHEPTTEVCSLAFSQDDRTLLSRGMDGTMKVWDLRSFKEPVRVWDNLPCGHPTTRAIFSPDESVIATGVTHEGAGAGAGAARETTGSLCFFDRKTFAPVRTLGMPGGVTALLWHHRLNQIFAGVGTRKTGSTRVLYDTAISERGVMQCVARAPRKADPLDYVPPMIVKSMGLLPLFREDPGRGKRHNETERVDPAKARKPDPGSTAGVGRQGRIGMTGKTILTLHMMKQKGTLMATEQEEDPREAMLRHDPNGMTSHFSAYAKTQPVNLLDAGSDEEGEEGEEGGGS
ncbi:MAG: hypothetical protein WDW36_009898 [Sanguina aurantia]